MPSAEDVEDIQEVIPLTKLHLSGKGHVGLEEGGDYIAMHVIETFAHR